MDPQAYSRFFLYGPPGSGKTSLGRMLAGQLSLPFYDLDQEIAARSGKPIPEIFKEEGEPGFRAREQASLDAVLRLPPGVVALGGGALLDEESRARVAAAGSVLLLTAAEAALAERLQASSTARPLLGSVWDAGSFTGRLDQLLQRREAHYASFPLRLDTGGLSREEAVSAAQVCLGAFQVSGMGSSYPVRVQTGGLSALGEALRQAGQSGPVSLASDQNVGALYAERAAAALETSGYAVRTVFIPPGETHKTIDTVASLWRAFLEAGLERGSAVVALGGGVLSDLAGFAAATYLRGVHWAVVPTSLLGMADASLGGKTGADLPQGKNLVGAFHPPSLVLADPRVLATLPPAELRSGLAEVVKHGILADPALFALCARGWDALQDEPVLSEAVRRAVAVKVRFIEADPYERGQRAALNLGHTIGHALEQATGFRLRHGEAVAIGMVAEARLSERIGLASKGLADEIEALLRGLGLPVKLPRGVSRDSIREAMQVDKKRASGKIHFALPVRIGEVHWGVVVAPSDVVL